MMSYKSTRKVVRLKAAVIKKRSWIVKEGRIGFGQHEAYSVFCILVHMEHWIKQWFVVCRIRCGR